MASKMSKLVKALSYERSKSETIEGVLNYIEDMAFDKYECVQLLEDIFGKERDDNPMTYDEIADEMIRPKKAGLFA